MERWREVSRKELGGLLTVELEASRTSTSTFGFGSTRFQLGEETTDSHTGNTFVTQMPLDFRNAGNDRLASRWTVWFSAVPGLGTSFGHLCNPDDEGILVHLH